MKETKMTFDHKDLPGEVVTLTVGTLLVRQWVPIDADKLDITLVIVEKTNEVNPL